ncbi:MAG: alpha/beta fold hydrolase [Solirubrobacteraceae bacterium]|nr:alpha/beta fold hydrolase [Solirubrobacteraceae bacterium]
MVLVHGAFGGAWCWEPVVGGRAAAGHTVETFDLPGSGDDPTPVEEVTLDAYADRICEVLAARPEPAVLVGHSMGGVAITQAAGRSPERIAKLVYVAAFLPRDGQSLIDLTHLPEGSDDQIQANLVVSGDPPVAEMPRDAIRDAVYQRCPEDVAAKLAERRGPQAVAPFATPVSLPDPDAVAAIPHAYVIATDDRSIPPALQRRMVREHGVTEVVEIEADHSPMHSATDELVAILDRIAAGRTTAGAQVA